VCSGSVDAVYLALNFSLLVDDGGYVLAMLRVVGCGHLTGPF
jgi:hypothetical protein